MTFIIIQWFVFCCWLYNLIDLHSMVSIIFVWFGFITCLYVFIFLFCKLCLELLSDFFQVHDIYSLFCFLCNLGEYSQHLLEGCLLSLIFMKKKNIHLNTELYNAQFTNLWVIYRTALLNMKINHWNTLGQQSLNC